MVVPAKIYSDFYSRIREFTIWNQLSTHPDDFKKKVICSYIKAFHEMQGVPNLPVEFSILAIINLKFRKSYIIFELRGNKEVRILAPS